MHAVHKANKRDVFLVPPPSNLLFFFVFHLSKNQKRREKGIYSKFHLPPESSFGFLSFIYLKNQRSKKRDFFLFLKVKSRGVGGGAAPPMLPVVEWKEGEKREGTLV